jgi:hypothetical protein
MLELYTGMEFMASELPKYPFYLYPLIPSSGIILFHGSPGVGKSTISWQLANCLERGDTFLGMPTNKTRVLFVSLDMPKYGLHARWEKSKFKPYFDLAIAEDFDVTHPLFAQTKVFGLLRDQVMTVGYGLVIIDSLAHVLNKSVNADEAPKQVYGTFKQWFPQSATMIIHHDRKKKTGDNGMVIDATDEDFLGSQQWKAQATSQIHIHRLTKALVRLEHQKCQVAEQMPVPLDLFMNDTGTSLEEWSEHKQEEEKVALLLAIESCKVKYPEWSKLSKTRRVVLIAEEVQKGQATVYRWMKALDKEDKKLL